MTFQEFDKFFDEFVEECRKMRDSKGKEYANSENRFDNFNRISKQIGISNVQVGMVYLTKHMDSIQAYLKTGKIHSTERIRGRFIDAVTYLILMAGMAEEAEADYPSEQFSVSHSLAALTCKVGDRMQYIGNIYTFTQPLTVVSVADYPNRIGLKSATGDMWCFPLSVLQHVPNY